MTTITINRATVEQALECLRGVARGKYDGNAAGVCTTLEAALAQQAEQVEPVEPVAWYYERDTDKGLSFAPDRDPYKCWQPLYTAPPNLVPLTDEEIGRLCDEVSWSPRQLVRAVERAHGIGRQTDPQIEDRLARHGIPKP